MSQPVIIPYRLNSGPLREACLYRVIDHLEGNGFYCAVTGELPWSPGGARNRGARGSRGDVLVFNDADTICPVEQLRAAVELAHDEQALVYAYDLYLRCAEGAGPEGPYERELYSPPSVGAVAIRRDLFWQLSGFTIAQWGEDVEFAGRCPSVLRVEGPVYHLWHGPRGDDDSPLDCESRTEENRAPWKSTA